MTAIEHNKIVAIGFAFFAVIFAFTFLLLMLVSLGVFVALGITFANETGDNTQAGIGILGGVFAVIFYLALAIVFVIPTAVASLKMLRGRRHTRIWGIIAAIALIPFMPLGTVLGVYALWFFFTEQGRQLYSSPGSEAHQALST